MKVRVQARDGKILGPAPTVRQPLLSVRNVLTRVTLIKDCPMNNGSSGTVVPVSKFSEGVSRNAIVVQPPGGTAAPGPYWLQPPAGLGELIVELHLTEPSLLEFTATAFAPDPVCASATMWVLPSMQLLADPGLVLTIAGLYTTVTASVANQTVTIQANVTMMCGCPITLQPPPAPPPPGEAPPEPYWPSGEFEVTAQIRANGGLDVLSFPLTCSGTSTFKGSLDLKPGTYDLWVVAVQPAETNVGFARATVVVP
ncbi:MAG TPA: hypothetical protein DD490_22500 [Acidobacteria bacterium]|nr:hypothetical protein [Acidobacteriota bacterium]